MPSESTSTSIDWPEYYRRLAVKRRRELDIRIAAGYSDENDPAISWYWDSLDMLTNNKRKR